MKTVLDAAVSGFPRLRSGKVREMFDLGASLLMVATDRISAFDVVMNEGIPGKGVALTSISAFWFGCVGDSIPHHFETTDISGLGLMPEEQSILSGRSMIVKKAEPLPVECIVRGYLAGSGWAEYKRTGAVHKMPMPAGISQSGRFPEPIFTPSTKSDEGHDVNISFMEMVDIVGRETAEQLRDYSLELYGMAGELAAGKGIIIADTKFEFGETDDGIILIDEVLTPDSSRFWPAASYEQGRSQASLDKQFLRDYLSGLDWDKTPPPPPLPASIIRETASKYEEIRSLLIG